MRAARLILHSALVGWLLAVVTPATAAEGGFSATLSAENQSASGLTELTIAERLALDQLVASDLALVRSGEDPDLPGTFVSRRSEAERKSAGLDRLTEAQRQKLNELVASALAGRPKPKERPRLKESDVIAAARERNRIHGSVSVAYGWGRGGRDFWAESLWLQYYDPEDRFSLGIGLSNFDGDGFYGYYPDYYGFYPDYYGGYGRRYYRSLPVAFATSPRGDFTAGEGQSFRGGGGGRSTGHGGRRGR